VYNEPKLLGFFREVNFSRAFGSVLSSIGLERCHFPFYHFLSSDGPFLNVFLGVDSTLLFYHMIALFPSSTAGRVSWYIGTVLHLTILLL
jgi:hypothetical protein